MPGVDRVLDLLVVNAATLPDGQVAQNIRSGIPESVREGTRDLEVIVRDGVVQISGFASTQNQKDVITNTAMFTPGVSSVDNRIEVLGKLPNEQRLTDRWISEGVEATLDSLPVNTLHVHFDVKDGDVVSTAPCSMRPTAPGLKKPSTMLPVWPL